MSDIQFDEPQNQMRYQSRRILGEPATPTVIKFLLKKGIARDEEHATKILMIAIGIMFFISIILFVNYINPPEANVYYSGSE